MLVHICGGKRNIMISNLNIYCTANLLMRRHLEEAPTHVAMRADELLSVRDLFEHQREEPARAIPVNVMTAECWLESLARRPRWARRNET